MAPELEAVYPADRLEEALADTDFVFDVRPLTRATRSSIGAKQLGRMRGSATYVNVGRAGTVDEEALYRHLSTHPDFRVALDCWWDEDYAAGTLAQRFPWTELPNFIGTPHSAGAVPGADEVTVSNWRLRTSAGSSQARPWYLAAPARLCRSRPRGGLCCRSRRRKSGKSLRFRWALPIRPDG